MSRLRLALLVCLMLFAGAMVSLLTSMPTAAQGPPNGQPVQCSVFNNANATLTAFTQSNCLATLGQALFITDIVATASAVATSTTDQQLQLKFGTGTNCGTGTTVIFNAYNPTADGIAVSLRTPIRVPQNVDLCWMDAVTGSKSFLVSGYLGQ